jgi:hypothetical protein
MKQPTFLEGVGVAFGLSLAGGAVLGASSLVLPGGWIFRGVVAGVSLLYVLYLLARSRERVGRITTVALWVLVAGAAWIAQPPLLLYVLTHVLLLWLIRSLYFYSSILSALADLALNGLGVAAAIWASVTTGSVFMGLWCFFLVQALFVAIPTTSRRGAGPGRNAGENDDRFEHAHRAAESALRNFYTAR